MTITLTIIIITALISVSAFSNQKVINDLIFYPPAISERNQWYRFFTCGFIHADWGHLIFNMLSLYFFGSAVEKYFPHYGLIGSSAYVVLYLSALLVSMLPTYFKHKNDQYYRSLGASGAVSAVITAAAVFNPWSMIYIMAIIPIPAIVYVVLFIVISAYMGKRGQDNINHDAHLWGALYGLAFTIILIYAYNPRLLEVLFYHLLNPPFLR